MSNLPTLLFLHGVGAGDPGDTWKSSLAQSLIRLGYPGLEGLPVIAPKFAHALRGADEEAPIPPLTVAQPARDAAGENRREFERRTGAIELRLGRHEGGERNVVNDMAVDWAVGTPQFVQAQKYLTEPKVRAQVLTKILGRLPDEGRIVIVGHSLGSVIAADLVRRLPAEVQVAGMVTIGSPLASSRFDVGKLREALKEPPTNLAWWVNIWNWHDPVAARRGVSSIFPWMIDLRIQTALSLHVHDAVEYLGEDVVAEAIGFALFGSRSKELALVERDFDIPTDDVESLALSALRYAHLTLRTLEGEQRERFAGALRRVQATVIEGLHARAIGEHRTLPADIARLAVDLSGPLSPLPEPKPARHLGKEEAIVPLIVLATENVIRPFEIEVHKDKQRDALAELTAEMGHGSQLGRDVFDALKGANDALGNGRTINWLKLGALGAGAAVLVVATGGLALAAAPGLAGAAAITSALATFGPGGMIGGLVTAGSLVTAGGGSIALGLAGPGTTAETLETVIARQLTTAILRQMQGIEQDPGVWRTLVETEIEVRRQYERLDEFSDASAASLKDIKRKLQSIERALKYLTENGLDPEGRPESGQ